MTDAAPATVSVRYRGYAIGVGRVAQAALWLWTVHVPDGGPQVAEGRATTADAAEIEAMNWIDNAIGVPQ